MRERKYVKFRVDMYEDTKFKIIDMKPERDVIHYIWNRLVMLAGKVNLEGDLFLSKSIPYTIETLAIEFNRDAAQIKLALEMFIELEMVELTDGKVYRVKNFAKHQNIKVKDVSKKESAELKDSNIQLSKACADEEISPGYKERDGKVIEYEMEDAVDSSLEVVDANSYELNIVDEGMGSKGSKDNLLEYSSKVLEKKKKAKGNKKKKGSTLNTEDIIEISDEDENIDGNGIMFEGERPLGKDEISVSQWVFG